MRRRKKVVLPRPELNITPMMDLVLNLITFFVLVANFAVLELPGLRPPNPSNSLAEKHENPHRVTLNILPSDAHDGTVGDILVDNIKVKAGDDQLAQLITVMEHEIKRTPDLEVHLRADESVHYDQIEPVLVLLANTGVTSLHVVAKTADAP